ncbi:SAM-dependent methyltransferase [Nocardia sp. CS682]|uniref:SAM-dependent methyltransferase n=1 Tax=Nocardia sp. CS682 TaxID=1047172 RepID=UPI0010757A7D|nr:SAM-dependent methyltransferase [Nocardia sp. CS682]QBS40862.1 SAM-dependent methyltransferase [Nocardia sp. CS682]
MNGTGLAADYFEDMYAHDPDPWGFTTRWYEQRKRALTMGALPKARYHNAFEPGCSIGTLSVELTDRCDRLVCTDIAAQALDSASKRIDRLPESERGAVEFRRWALGEQWPNEHFDLIVLSEVCYYLDSTTLRTAFGQAVQHLEPGGTLLCVHWRRKVPEYPLSGDHVHAIARTTQGLTALAGYHDEDMLLDVFTAGDPVSVATTEHLT